MGTSDRFKYRAFLSYSHADTAAARQLHKRLEGFRLRDLTGRNTPHGEVPASLRPVFRDRHDFGAGQRLPEATRLALEQSAALVVLCSPACAKSTNVDAEIRLFKINHPDRPIVPVIVGTARGVAADACFPPALRFELDTSGSTTETPATVLAADMRASGDGEQLAVSKVVAALVGVSTDQVFRRAERERRRRALVRNSIAASFLAVLAASGFIYYRGHRTETALLDTGAACRRYLPPTGTLPSRLLDPLQQCIASLEALQRGAASDPRDAEALRLFAGGRKDEAERLQVQAAADDEAAGNARIKKAAERYRIIADTAGFGDPVKARMYFRKAIALDPDDWLSLMPLGIIEMEEGNLKEAKALLERILPLTGARLEVLMPIAKIALGNIASQQGDDETAMKFLSDCGAGDKVPWNNSEAGKAMFRNYRSLCNAYVVKIMDRRGDVDASVKIETEDFAYYEQLLGGSHTGWMGAELVQLTNQELSAVGISSGVRLTPRIGGPANVAGIVAGDIAISIDAEPVTTTEEFIGSIARRLPSSFVTVVVLRDGNRIEHRVQLSERPPQQVEATKKIDADELKFLRTGGVGIATRLVTRLVGLRRSDEAERVARKGLEWAELVFSQNPPDAVNLQVKASAHTTLAAALGGAETTDNARIRTVLANYFAAAKLSRAAVEILGELQSADQLYLSSSSNSFSILINLKEYDNALRIADEVIAFAAYRAKQGPLNPSTTLELAKAHLARCDVAWQRNEIISGQVDCRLALNALNEVKAEATNREAQDLIASLKARLADGQKRTVLFELNKKSEESFLAGDFSTAAKDAAELATLLEEYTSAVTGKPTAFSAEKFATLAWYRLFARDFSGALEASQKATTIEPSGLVYASNTPHALMFLNQIDAARAAYLAHKGEPLAEGRLWEDELLNDLVEFEKHGLTHPFMAEVRALLQKR